MHRVLVAWDADDAKRFLRHLESHGIRAHVLEDREYPQRGELHDTEGAPEVWIDDVSKLPRAQELAAEFEAKRRDAGRPPESSGDDEPT